MATSSQPRRNYTKSMSLLGTVTSVDVPNVAFSLRCRSGDEFRVQVGTETSFSVLQNMDDLDRDRLPNPPDYDPSKGPSEKVRKYIIAGYMLVAAGVEIENAGTQRFDARVITLLTGDQDQFVFEDTHWWLTQIAAFADQWLDGLFANRRSYEVDDFAG